MPCSVSPATRPLYNALNLLIILFIIDRLAEFLDFPNLVAPLCLILVIAFILIQYSLVTVRKFN